MRINEILTESLSPIVYHYASAPTALKILDSGKFELSSSYGSDVEHQYAPKGYPYFLSTTRTRLGDYHKNPSSSGGVLFNMDGTWYNQRYPAKSVDYWVNRDPAKAYGRAHEAEDRLFSREPTIPITGVTSIDILAKNLDSEPTYASRIRKLLIAAKRLGIKTYLYTDLDAWILGDKRKLADVSILDRGTEKKSGRNYYGRRDRGYLMPWIEVILGKDKSKMSKRANEIIYSIKHHLGGYYERDLIQGFETYLANGRKPDSGPDRNHVITINQFMRQNRLNTTKELLKYLKDKWSEK